MSKIYVACGGTTQDYSSYPTMDPDGIYDIVVGGYDRIDDANYILRTNGSYWELRYNSLVLYQLYQEEMGDPISSTNWTAVNGSSPVVKTFEYVSTDTIIFDKIILTGAGTTAVNGTYTWNNAVTVGYNTGDGTVVSGYLHSSGTYIIRIVNNVWEVRLVYNDDSIYESSLPDTEPPIGSFTQGFGSGDLPAPSSSHDTSLLCGSVSQSNFFIRRSSDQNFIDFRNSTAYIRKS